MNEAWYKYNKFRRYNTADGANRGDSLHTNNCSNPPGDCWIGQGTESCDTCSLYQPWLGVASLEDSFSKYVSQPSDSKISKNIGVILKFITKFSKHRGKTAKSWFYVSPRSRSSQERWQIVQHKMGQNIRPQIVFLSIIHQAIHKNHILTCYPLE